MRFEARLREGIEQGTIVLAFRRWKRCQVVAGHRYRTGTGMVAVKLTARLARMDRTGAHGPWTGAVLTQIADRPGTVSTVLAEALGWERQDFKLHVRRLKELGLTISLTVGYELSPRGATYLDRLRRTAG